MPDSPTGYHVTHITKGLFGEASKIEEEFQEWKAAINQEVKVLELVELSDLIGAIEGYVVNKFSMTLDDLVKMKNLTAKAFLDGTRVQKVPAAVTPPQKEMINITLNGCKSVIPKPKPPTVMHDVIVATPHNINLKLTAYDYRFAAEKCSPNDPDDVRWTPTKEGQHMYMGNIYAIMRNHEHDPLD